MLLEKLFQVVVLLIILLFTIKVVPIFIVVPSIQFLFHAINYLLEQTQRDLLPDQKVQYLVQDCTKLLLTTDNLLGLLLADDGDQTRSSV